MPKIKRILVPVDFSPASLKALDYAADFAQPLGADLSVLFVIEPIYYAVPDLAGAAAGTAVGLLEEQRASGKRAARAPAGALRQTPHQAAHADADRHAVPGDRRRGEVAEGPPHRHVDARPHRRLASAPRQRRRTRRALGDVPGADDSGEVSAKTKAERRTMKDEDLRVFGRSSFVFRPPLTVSRTARCRCGPRGRCDRRPGRRLRRRCRAGRARGRCGRACRPRRDRPAAPGPRRRRWSRRRP